jgi:MFS family permease
VVWVLAGGRFVSSAVSFMMLYLFVYLTGPRGLTPAVAGLVSGALGAGMLLGNFTGGRFGDRYGHRRVFLSTSTAASIACLAVPWLPTPALAPVIPVLGYLTAAGGVAQGALVALAMPIGDRRRSVAITRAASNAGFVIGPPIGALLAVHSFTAMFVLQGALLLVVRGVTARWLPAAQPAPATSAVPGLLRSVLADRTLLALLPAIVVVDIVYRQLYSTLPLYLRDHGQPIGLYGGLIALGSGLILVLEVPVAVWLRRRPALNIVSIGYALVGLGFAIFGFGAAAWLAVAGMLVLTAGEILYKTTATAYVLDIAPAGLTGQYQGLYTGAATSGTLLAPVIGGVVYGGAPSLLWPLCALLALAAGAVVWALSRRPVVVDPTGVMPAVAGALPSRGGAGTP